MDETSVNEAASDARAVRLTVVIPVRDGGADFERCLQGLARSQFREFELVVVDDGSRDASARLAEAHGARVIRHDQPQGPAAARNEGVAAARSPLIFFLDADVIPHPDTLTLALQHLDRETHLAALFGSYDAQPTAPGLVSRFRNLLHHHVHQTGAFHDNRRPAHTFWTGCGVIRREAFLAVGGFDPSLYRRPAIEDIELGYRLVRSGQHIALARDVQVSHQKRWSLASMIRTDIFHRGVPWMLLLLRHRMPESDLNVKQTQRLAVGLTAAVLLALIASLVTPWALLAAGAAISAIGWLNRDLYGFLARDRGVSFAACCLPIHLVYYACCGLSVALALGWHLTHRAGTAPAELTGRTDPPHRHALGRLVRRTRGTWKSRAAVAEQPRT